MKTYAYVDGGKVVEVIGPLTNTDGSEVPITSRFTPDFVLHLVDVTSVPGIAQGWVYANGVFAAPSASLTDAQSAQIAKMAASYAAAISQPVSFTSAGGVSKTFQADAQSVANLQSMLAACTPAGKAPTGFYWVAADNTQVPFTLADMQGLAQAIGAQGWAAFQQLQALKATILAATSVSSVQAVSW